MNRFDTSTIWNSASEKVDGQEGESPFEEDPESSASSCGDSNSTHGPREHNLGQSEAFDGPCGSNWASALRAQTFFVPLHYEQNYRYPLVVWLHSDGFNENQVSHVMPHVSSRNYLATGIRAPKATDASGHRFAWSDADAAFHSAQRSVLEAIDRAASLYSVHAQRIVLAGYQEGGSMAMQIAMRHPELFSAAISLGGSFELDSITQEDRERLKVRHLPMLWQHSLESERYCESKLVDEIGEAQSISAKLEIRQYRNDDEMNTVVLRDLDRWIMQHVVSGVPVAKMSQWDSSPTSFSDN